MRNKEKAGYNKSYFNNNVSIKYSNNIMIIVLLLIILIYN